MTNTPSTPQETGRRRRTWKRIKGGIYLAGSIAAVLALPIPYHIYTLNHADESKSTTEPPTSTTTYSTHIQDPTQDPELPTSSTPGCYDEDNLTQCGSQHTREIYVSSNGACDDASAILYLGGTPETDLLTSELSIEEVPGSDGMCAITHDEGLPTTSLEGLWRKDGDNDGYLDGGAMRRCFSHQGIATSCDDPHSSEVIYQGDQEADCREQYQLFAGRRADSDRNIRFVGHPEGDQFTCRVEVQVSSESLLRSVRNLNDTRPLIR